jgi:hypothetical protein
MVMVTAAAASWLSAAAALTLHVVVSVMHMLAIRRRSPIAAQRGSRPRRPVVLQLLLAGFDRRARRL